MNQLRFEPLWNSLKAILVGAALLLILLLGDYKPTVPSSVLAAERSSQQKVYLPLVMKNYIPPLCRFGVGAGQDIASYAINELRIGWYVDWTVTQFPARPNGISYMPTIRLKQIGSDSYSYAPDGAVLAAAITANPGSLWLIGNEPDRRKYQDDLVPSVYALAYHDLYHLIKGLDPTARIGAGGIVQPTPLRLQYLDMVLASYQSRYRTMMPVDVWNIHAFILNETSCDCDPDNCWGAEVPPGINVCYGRQYDVQDNDNLTIFRQHIVDFRQWMANNGYQNHPLIITEFGVQMPGGGYFDPDFTPQRVNAFMNATFDYLSLTTSPSGYPADGYHLVQRWAWYSLTDDYFNGWLFDPVTKARTVFGDNYAAYTSRVVSNGCGW